MASAGALGHQAEQVDPDALVEVVERLDARVLPPVARIELDGGQLFGLTLHAASPLERNGGGDLLEYVDRVGSCVGGPGKPALTTEKAVAVLVQHDQVCRQFGPEPLVGPVVHLEAAWSVTDLAPMACPLERPFLLRSPLRAPEVRLVVHQAALLRTARSSSI